MAPGYEDMDAKLAAGKKDEWTVALTGPKGGSAPSRTVKDYGEACKLAYAEIAEGRASKATIFRLSTWTVG